MFVRFFPVLFVAVQLGRAVDDCQTPYGQSGDCKPINNCQSLYSLVERRPISSSTADYLRRSQCGFVGAYPKVCCPLGSTVVVVSTSKPTTNLKLVRSNLLPNSSVCGQYSEDRLYTGLTAALDAFPWLALVEYEKPGGSRGFYCGGVLINDRYVLTAAHCVKGEGLPKTWKLFSVRLGEYNTETDKDCIKYNFGEDCAPLPLNIPVEQSIAHESYEPNNINQYHDIALLRLKEKVKFSDFVMPICLPTTTEELRKSHIGQKLDVAGWGISDNGSKSNIKLKVQLSVKEPAECNNTYQQANVTLGGGQLCAGGKTGKDSCRGNTGGPLMDVSLDLNRDVYWYVAGVLSFTTTPCGVRNWPAVYTNVSKYVAWIVGKLKP